MLLGNHGVVCPAKQGLITQTIVFNDIPHLHSILFDKLSGKTTESSSRNLPGLLPDLREESEEILPETTLYPQDAYEVPLGISPSRPESPIAAADPEAQDEQVIQDENVEAKLTPEDAVLCIQTSWRTASERQAQRRRLNEFDHEGRLYEEYHSHFPKMGKLSTARDMWALRLIRAPCLSIVLALQMLVAEMEEYLEHIDDNLKGENLSLNDVAEIQKTNKRNRELVE